MSDDTASTRERSRFVRILGTPIGDLLRGEITGPVERGPRGERGYRAAILNAGLPRPLADLALEVTRRTRLRRREKLDVARELVAHFRDGLEAGATSDGLSAGFGNPVQAAKLIRRAKKRNRSLLWHAWINTWRTIGAVILACVVLYGVLAFRYWTGKPTISRNIIAELNAPTLALPESERAWTYYREAYLALPVMPEPIMNSGAWPAIEPTDADWPVYCAYVDALQPTIHLLRKASRVPHMGFILTDAYDDPEMTAHANAIRGQLSTDGGPPPPVLQPSENPWVVNVLLSYLGNMRGFARDLAADARIALFQSDSERFMADFEALTQMASHSAESPFLISRLVGIAIDAVALDLVGNALEERPTLLSDADLVALAHRAGALQTDIDIGMESAFFEDTIQRLYSDDGHGDGRLIGTAIASLHAASGWDEQLIGSPAAPVIAALAADRKEVVNEWNRVTGIMRAEAAAPMWTWTTIPGQREMDRLTERTWYNVRYFPISLLLPAVGRIAEASNKAAMRRDATVIVLALELWKRKFGSYPATLLEMTPEYLPTVPLDRFDGLPLKYVVRNGLATVYSAGRDRDDDGGRPPVNAGGLVQTWGSAEAVSKELADAAKAPSADGDWVIWPLPKYTEEGALIPRD